MASIISVNGKWRATVRVKRDGVLILNRTKSFDSKRDAEQWARGMEVKVDHEGVDEVASQIKLKGVSVGDILREYIKDFDTVDKPFGRTKRAALEIMARAPIGSVLASKISSRDVLQFARDRRESHRAGPAAIYQYVTYLRLALNTAKPAWGYNIDGKAVDDALPVLRLAGLSGQGVERDRRLRSGEYRALLRYFRRKDTTARSPLRMEVVLRFLVRLPLRLGEFLNMRWEDIDVAKRTAIIRDRKDPRNKKGNDQTVPLLGRAWDIVQAQPTRKGRVFPFVDVTVKSAWQRGCEVCGIEDLHLHDLRHEGISRMFEAGYQIQEVAVVSGHKNWNMLRRYTQIKPESLHR